MANGMTETTKCAKCGREEELRLGYCFNCVSEGERRAAKRTVWQHFLKGLSKLHQPKRLWQIRYDWQWAWERLTRTGDYAPGGVFDKEGYDWR